MRDVLKVIAIGGVLAVPFISLVVIDTQFFPYITGKNFIFRIVVEIIFAAWIILALYDRTYRPRFSYILAGALALVAVLFVANVSGAHPETSWWSNFERMEGYLTIVHLFLYFVVAGSVLNTPKLWSWFWHLSLVAATFVAAGAVAEYFDPDITRVSGVLGNAAYLAIYMLFHIFLVLYLFVRNPKIELRILYAVLGLVFVFILLQTSTRGTAIGMATGLVTTVAYIAIFARANPQFRRLAIGSCAALLVLAGSFWLVKDQDIIQTSPTLSRIANIDLQEDLEVRFAIWNVAWQGVQERPVLGWGQENFTYVFDKYYDPFLYDQEQWFDRTHNIFLDWLIAGGVLALVAYLSIVLAAGYYLSRRQSVGETGQQFTVLEQAVLLGLLVGYLTHNLVVFDNIVSYIFFFSVLAMIHARVSSPITYIQTLSITPYVVKVVVIPVVVVVVSMSIYFSTVPHWMASTSLIGAISNFDVGVAKIQNQDSTANQNFAQAEKYFIQAIEQDSFAEQEIVEQLTQRTLQMIALPEVDEELRNRFVQLAEQELVKLQRHKPDFARVHIFRGVYYRAVGDTASARDAYATARSISPQKPDIVFNQGVTELVAEDIPSARDYFAETLALDERNHRARAMYVATLFMLGDSERAESVLVAGGRAAVQYYATDQYVMQAANAQASPELLIRLYQAKTSSSESRPQDWINLAVLQYEYVDPQSAVATLTRAQEEFAADAARFTCVIANIEAGNAPGLGCDEQ